jgi:hypothetical protein
VPVQDADLWDLSATTMVEILGNFLKSGLKKLTSRKGWPIFGLKKLTNGQGNCPFSLKKLNFWTILGRNFPGPVQVQHVRFGVRTLLNAEPNTILCQNKFILKIDATNSTKKSCIFVRIITLCVVSKVCIQLCNEGVDVLGRNNSSTDMPIPERMATRMKHCTLTGHLKRNFDR